MRTLGRGRRASQLASARSIRHVEPVHAATRDRLQQVVWNLLSNAVRFTPTGGRVMVSLGRTEGFDTLRVRDTGAGIEAQFVPYVFEPFRQADIGLTIVRRLTEMHGGTVAVASDGPGLGATFTVMLPVRDTRGASASPSEPGRVATLTGAKVLVVDDDPDTLELLEQTLRIAGATPLPPGRWPKRST